MFLAEVWFPVLWIRNCFAMCNRWRPLTTFPLIEAVLGLLHPVAGRVLRRGLKFKICTHILNIFFNNSGNFWVSPTYINTNIIPPIMFINRTYGYQNFLSLWLIFFLVGLRNYQHPYMYSYIQCPCGKRSVALHF